MRAAELFTKRVDELDQDIKRLKGRVAARTTMNLSTKSRQRYSVVSIMLLRDQIKELTKLRQLNNELLGAVK